MFLASPAKSNCNQGSFVQAKLHLRDPGRFVSFKRSILSRSGARELNAGTAKPRRTDPVLVYLSPSLRSVRPGRGHLLSQSLTLATPDRPERISRGTSAQNPGLPRDNKQTPANQGSVCRS